MSEKKGYFGRFVRTRAAGFYLTAVTVILAIVQMIVYQATYGAGNSKLSVYYAPEAIILSVVAVVLCIAMMLCKWTDPWAPLVLFALEFWSFLMFASGTYLYLTEVFYAGVTAEAFGILEGGFTLSVILYVAILLCSIVALFMRQSKKEDAAAGLSRKNTIGGKNK